LKKSKEKSRDVLSAESLGQKEFQKESGSAQEKNAIKNLLQRFIILNNKVNQKQTKTECQPTNVLSAEEKLKAKILIRDLFVLTAGPRFFTNREPVLKK